jgi:hypothetical protein
MNVIRAMAHGWVPELIVMSASEAVLEAVCLAVKAVFMCLMVIVVSLDH